MGQELTFKLKRVKDAQIEDVCYLHVYPSEIASDFAIIDVFPTTDIDTVYNHFEVVHQLFNHIHKHEKRIKSLRAKRNSIANQIKICNNKETYNSIQCALDEVDEDIELVQNIIDKYREFIDGLNCMNVIAENNNLMSECEAGELFVLTYSNC